GLAAWARVRDHRVAQFHKLPNVEVHRGSRLMAEDVLELGAPRVVLATGARWRRDGVGRLHGFPVPGFDLARVHTPDEIMEGIRPLGPVLLFDDDHFYLGGVLAERLARDGLAVTLVTPAPLVSAWTVNTLEQGRIQKQLLELGVVIL